MAPVITPAKSFINIRSGMKSVISGLGSLTTKTVRLNSILLRKTKVKRESIAKNYILSQRREESARRRDREDIIESSSIGGVFKRQAKAIASSTKGFLGRIMDFLGTLLVGWLMYNLPSIITMAQELIGRMQRLYTIATGFLNSTANMFKGFGNVLGAIGKNILTFDFTDSHNRVKNATNDLGNTFDDMQSQFDDAFKLLTTSLGEGIATGKNAQPFGTQYPNQSFQEQPSASPSGTSGTSGGGNKASAGTKEQKAMLDTISYAEGKTGYSTWFGFQRHGPEDLTNLTVKEVHDLQGTFLSSGKGNFSGGRSAAVGRYQFVPLLEHTKRFGRNPSTQKFTPQFQDELANFLAKNRGVTQELLAKEGMSDNVIQKLSPEWASFPGNTYGQPTKRKSDLKNVYAQSLRATPIQTQPTPRTPTPAQTSPTLTAQAPTSINSNKNISVGSKIGSTIKTDFFGSMNKRSRPHGGIDLGCDVGTYISCKYPCKVVEAKFEGGYGYYTDIIIPSLNVRLRFAHLSKQLIKGGDVPAGKPFAQSGNTGRSTGPHIHMEATRNMGGTAYGGELNPDPYTDALIFSKNAPQGFIAPPTPTPAQIASTGTQQRRQTPQNLAQNKPGPTVVVLEEDPPPAPQSQVSAGGGGIIPIIINPLNSFITQKLLLDLAYT